MQWINAKSDLPKSDYAMVYSCLVKTNKEEIFKLNYDTEYERWQYPESNIPYDNEDYGIIEYYVFLSNLDRDLTNQSVYWAYNFNDAFIENAIPALKMWIEKGCSNPINVDLDVWNNIKQTILDAFVEYKQFNDGRFDLTVEDRKIKVKEITNKIKIAFNLIGEYFDDMWD